MAHNTKHFFEFTPFLLNRTDRLLTKSGANVHLTPKVFQMLEHLVANAGRPVGREELKRAVWQTEHISSNSVDQKISEIRDALGEFGESYLENRRAQGWCLKVTVVERTQRPPAAVQTKSHAPVLFPPSTQTRAPKPLGRPAAALAVAVVIASSVLLLNAFPKQPLLVVTETRQLTFDGSDKRPPLVTDGRKAYFQEVVKEGAQNEFVTAAIALGGHDTEIQAPPLGRAVVYDYSARTGHFLLSARAQSANPPTQMWKPKAEPVRLRDNPGSHMALSPDARWYTQTDDQNLWIARVPPANHDLKVSVTQAAYPQWSPDGNRIRFSRREIPAERYSFWEVRRDGTDLRRLPLDLDLPTPVGVCCGKWLKGGRYYAFRALMPDSTGRLAIVDERSVERKPELITNPPLDVLDFVASPEGTGLLALVRVSRGELVYYDRGKGEFLPFWGGASAAEVMFSRDGRRAAFCSYPDQSLWVSDSDGSHRIRLTNPPMEVHQPQWSPDQRQIAFMGRTHAGGKWQAWVIDVAGGSPRGIKPDDSFEQGVPTWSADGRQVVFGELQLRKPQEAMSIHVVDVGTGSRRVLKESHGKWTPRWSPDGRSIAAEASDFRSLFIFDWGSQTWRALMNGTEHINDPVWSADSRYIHYRASRYPEEGLFRVRVKDGLVEKIATAPECQTGWAGITPSGSPTVFRAVRTSEIFELKLGGW